MPDDSNIQEKKDQGTYSIPKSWRQQKNNLDIKHFKQGQSSFPLFSFLFSYPSSSTVPVLKKEFFGNKDFSCSLQNKKMKITFCITGIKNDFNDDILYKLKSFFDETDFSLKTEVEGFLNQLIENFWEYYENIDEELKRYDSIAIGAFFFISDKAYFFAFSVGNDPVLIKINDDEYIDKNKALCLAQGVRKRDQFFLVKREVDLNLELEVEIDIPLEDGLTVESEEQQERCCCNFM